MTENRTLGLITEAREEARTARASTRRDPDGHGSICDLEADEDLLDRLADELALSTLSLTCVTDELVLAALNASEAKDRELAGFAPAQQADDLSLWGPNNVAKMRAALVAVGELQLQLAGHQADLEDVAQISESLSPGALRARGEGSIRVVRDFDKDLKGGYTIETDGRRFRRVWNEPGQPPEVGDWRATEADAIEAAANNWEACGMGRPTYLAMLRREATKARKRQQAEGAS